ncbi:MAG: hypothetical protein A2261_03370 [Candidatus Magasanikbacteria bacterium RIFOXYA2_FULL_44_8]|uniref:PsbP C-terminal domain-containing protein n=1 Tax=Candidatus Magasanikbacteria bacterium RIFOXYA2_FULL_44_8 TaxID=1798696 RepID=A0A1F6NI25_9BACT|nr:MAG: hypothetical protein A2261_03370 [Candidatus Magasanikbacteria bacterium RIFOXYA2_FULL_44_8]
MRTNQTIKLVLLGFLVFFVAGCGTVQPAGAPVPVDYNQLVLEDTGKMPITHDNLDANVVWKPYSKRAYGLSFSYPANWTMRAVPQGNKSVLVSVSNVGCQVQCPPQFVGLEIKSGIERSTSTDFGSWLGHSIASGEIPGMPAGTKAKLSKLGKRTAWFTDKSMLSGANDGYTYFLEQDESHYVYVSVGLNNLLPKAKDYAKRVADTVRVARLPMDESASGDTGDDGDGTVEEGVSIDSDTAIAQMGEKRYLNNYYRFSLIFPGNCKLLNITEDIDPPVQMELSLCTPNGETQKMGVRIFKNTTADTVASSLFGGRSINYKTSSNKILLSDGVVGINVNISGSNNSLPERWIVLERTNIVYVLYVLDNTAPYKAWFDFVIRRFKLLY